MMKVIKTCLLIGICSLCVALSFSVGAANPRTRYATIPSFAVLSDSVSLYPGEDRSFFLLSADSSNTLLTRFDANSSQFTVILSEPFSYTAAAHNQDTLLIAACTMQFDSQQQEFIRSTTVTRYSVITGKRESIVIPNLYLSSKQCLALDRRGYLYAADSESPDVLRVYDLQGVLRDSIPCGGTLSSITASPSGDRLFLTDSESGRFYCLKPLAAEGLQSISSPAPVLPYRFLGDTGFVDGLGDIYFSDGSDGYRLAYSTLCSQSLVDVLEQSVLCIPDGGPLLHLDLSSGEAAAQQEVEEGALELRVSGNTAAVLLSDSSGYRIGYLDLTSPDPLQPTAYSPAYNALDQSQIAVLWQGSLPKNLRNSQVYTRCADLNNFEYPSSLSTQTLTDGLNAVNFYRTLWGLPPAKLDQTGCDELAFGAVLALLGNGSQPEEQPSGMPDPFYQTAQKAMLKSNVSVQEAITPYPLAQAVHQWIKTDPSVRDLLLSPELSCLSFGAATGNDGTTCVLLYGQPSGRSAITAFPPGGICPLSLTNSGSWSLRLDQSLLAGVRGLPRVVITDRKTGGTTVLTLDQGLSFENNLLVWDNPTSEEGLYSICVENLCTPEGLPATITYDVSLFEMDLTLPPPEDDPIPPPEEGCIESELYHIDRERGLIYGIAASTSKSAFQKNLSGNGTIELRKNGRPAASGNAGTGMEVVLLRNGQVVDELTLLVYGDLTGEGNVNTLDFRALYQHLLEQKILSKPFSFAADLNRDGQINTLDLLAADKFLSGSYDISQD